MSYDEIMPGTKRPSRDFMIEKKVWRQNARLTMKPLNKSQCGSIIYL